MGILLGASALLVAAVALHRLKASAQIRRVVEGLFRRALPGARTGRRNDPANDAPPVVEPVSHFRWAEVVNLTASAVASPPRRVAPPREATEHTPVEHR